MSSVKPVDNGYVQGGYIRVPQQPVTSSSPHKTPIDSGVINCTDLYSQKEIKDILKKIGTQAPKLPKDVFFVPRYSVEYYSNSDTLVINNLAMTNDTTEILSDGSVRHVGSWHNKEVAPAGSFNELLSDAKRRIREDLTH